MSRWRRPCTLQAFDVAAAMLKWKPLPCRADAGGSQSCLRAHTDTAACETVQVLCPADQRQADLKLLEAPPDAAAGKTTRLIPNAKDADDEDDEDDSADESDDDEVQGLAAHWTCCCEFCICLQRIPGLLQSACLQSGCRLCTL